MPDEIFDHPRLARIYDDFDGERDDLAAYLALADELGAKTVLDVGCGTGNLAILLAARGRAVTGVDPSSASLEIARAKPGAGDVTWLDGDATTLPAMAVDLATMTGNVAQVFLTDDEWLRTLRGIHAALRPGGHFVFETRRPRRRAWEDWGGGRRDFALDIPGVGRVEQFVEVTDVSLPLVSFTHTYRFAEDGFEITSPSTLRFRDRPELEESLATEGFLVLDVRDAPDRPGREFVFVARRV
ncbi:class I SAM-dependent methyltransferase [Saccharothrix violaceirubra]|uniref:SAM-dependent methyltransferase n=1 Tax=Saccharothrix violaceirubra TaxID=413306 RepID=A0A7W7T4T2_9PSEU|nr:class I SAM-dependent methyltransferase [Saccharothrix violaceirubra]MBB4966550.1 SAM-dependent methyltransferase [Saccharothrix violaceirubra]